MGGGGGGGGIPKEKTPCGFNGGRRRLGRNLNWCNGFKGGEKLNKQQGRNEKRIKFNQKVTAQKRKKRDEGGRRPPQCRAQTWGFSSFVLDFTGGKISTGWGVLGGGNGVQRTWQGRYDYTGGETTYTNAKQLQSIK